MAYPNSNLGLILGQVVSASGYGVSKATVLGSPASRFQMYDVKDVEAGTDSDGFFALMFE